MEANNTQELNEKITEIKKIKSKIKKEREKLFLLKVNKELWNRFLKTLPLSISASEKIRRLIFNYVIEYEGVILKESKLEIIEDKNKKDGVTS